MTRILAITAAVLAAIAVGVAGYAAFKDNGSKTVVRQVTVSGGTPTSTTTAVSAVTNVYNSAYRGVVEITVNQTSQYGEQGTAQGSGFVYDGAGHIVTNEHVVEGGTTMSVRFWNGARYSATLVGTDPSTDLAVIKVNAPASILHPLQVGTSSSVQVGEPVVAIGSPYGLEETVTSGIVSALHRQMTAPNNFTIPDSIQTDAAINHGNSGGPLLDLNARVIGVNAQIKSETGENTGVGFAIPSDTVRSIVSRLASGGVVKHAYLGVSIGNSSNGQGVVLNEVRPGTPAAKAGLQAGDVVTRIDGTSVTDYVALGEAIDAKQPGDKVTLTYERNGASHTATVTLATRPS